MTATNTVSSVYQTNVVLMREKIRLNAVQPKNNARAKSGARSCCAARTRKPQQEEKVPYFCGLTARTGEHKKVKNLSRKKLNKTRKPQEGARSCLQVFLAFLFEHHLYNQLQKYFETLYRILA